MNNFNRIDVLLKRLGILKSREQAKLACEKGRITRDGKRLKPSSPIYIDDIIKIEFTDRIIAYKLINIPESKNVKKTKSKDYYQIVENYEHI
ncbi:RNA-binding S4 domain-containing protein [candidate division WOR-3 bacterium]|jgi:ribosomal 50S subunit-recycling heat shock protein|nr:RNA-binding S4 domain-containing protein [candidate division WOR-3 bacterium]